ncbi:hypothetical protein CMU68_10195 [Elizabethkingia anophelis]|nr:hypothetical protein [Elizabethkingia anophelis]MCT3993093.1 hypothetical protein [Elizabethkingia anophelis]MCT3997150.1 hypothetical protein [Elizabethkingia anophelis]MDV3585562.1 hypothetical protein [Elizabethkingia anophelis]MDV3786223.1 hypothetical protein [Elizabethkingia anophelis]
MKTKYIAVPVSERLPDKEELYLVRSKQGFISEMKFYKDEEWLWKSSKEYWLEEKEDHSEEMLSMLQRILDLNILPAEIDDEVISLTLKAQGYDMNQINEISQNGFERTKQLINKVKDNG